jgi:uncharacterized protein YggT (Ycf19 family)
MTIFEFIQKTMPTSEEEFKLTIGYFFCTLLLNFASFIYFSIKFYRCVCYMKMTLDWLPLFNPYEWPLSMVGSLTDFYFDFWRTFLPPLRFSKSSLDISGIVALESLGSLLYYCVVISDILLFQLAVIEAKQS